MTARIDLGRMQVIQNLQKIATQKQVLQACLDQKTLKAFEQGGVDVFVQNSSNIVNKLVKPTLPFFRWFEHDE